MQFPLGLMIILCVVMMIVMVIQPLSEMAILYYYGHRVQGDALAAGWAAFSDYDLEAFATREQINDREPRHIYLDRVLATQTVEDYLKENMKLDDGYYPLSGSYIRRNFPMGVIITIINPDQLPYDMGGGNMLNETAIYLELNVPIRKEDPPYLMKTLYVTADSFLISDQH